MKGYLAILVLLASTIACHGQEPKPPKLTHEQINALVDAKQEATTALQKVYESADYKVFLKASKDYQAARAAATKGVDPKKWVLGDDMVFTPPQAQPPAQAAVPATPAETNPSK